MLTIALLLLWPAVLGMPTWRPKYLLRKLMAHRRAVDTRRRLLCALGFGVMFGFEWVLYYSVKPVTQA